MKCNNLLYIGRQNKETVYVEVGVPGFTIARKVLRPIPFLVSSCRVCNVLVTEGPFRRSSTVYCEGERRVSDQDTGFSPILYLRSRTI